MVSLVGGQLWKICVSLLEMVWLPLIFVWGGELRIQPLLVFVSGIHLFVVIFSTDSTTFVSGIFYLSWLRILASFVFGYDLLISYKEELGQLITLEQGKPLKEAIGEVSYGAGFIELYAEEAKRVYGDIIRPTLSDRRLFVLKQVLG